MEEVKDVFLRRKAKHHVHVGKAQVRINEHHLFAKLCKAYGQVDRDIGLAYPALAGSDGKYQGECAAHLCAPHSLGRA